jgi:hypothetical protein
MTLLKPRLDRLRRLLSHTPLLWRLNRVFEERFPGSVQYWEQRYRNGGNSGAGSYGALAHFKADFLNALVAKEGINSVIEFGCGDGAQLSLAAYPRYCGLDVTKTSIGMCIAKYREDHTKSFILYDSQFFWDPARTLSADLTLSLDVIYHLIEDPVFDRYMNHLFAASTRFVIIYSTDFDQSIPNFHVRHRNFSKVIENRFPEWRLVLREMQKYPMTQPGEFGSLCDFFVYERYVRSAFEPQ